MKRIEEKNGIIKCEVDRNHIVHLAIKKLSGWKGKTVFPFEGVRDIEGEPDINKCTHTHKAVNKGGREE